VFGADHIAAERRRCDDEPADRARMPDGQLHPDLTAVAEPERAGAGARGGPGGGLDATAAQPGTVTSCHSPPLRLRLLPKAWPGAVSPT